MVDFWLDSNVFIEGRKGPYGFDIAPRFWKLLDELIDDNVLACPMLVYGELQDGQDDLAIWGRAHRISGLFVEADRHVQEAYRKVIGYVTQHYPDNQARRRFLSRADPWVIAHALANNCTVVTLEAKVPANSQQVKIPNVCDNLGTRWINTYQLLRELGASWT